MSKKPTEKQAIKAARILKKWCCGYSCEICIINKTGCHWSDRTYPGLWNINELPAKKKNKTSKLNSTPLEH